MSARMEERMEALEKQMQKLQDEKAIQEMMSRHAVNHVQKNMHRSVQYFALDEPDVSFEIGDRGVYKGAQALQTLFRDQFGAAVLKGNLLIQFLTTPSIQIAGDGKTAKGMWRCLQAESVVPKDNAEGQAEPIWAAGAYGADFIKKGSEWKIWHLHWFRNFKANHNQGWVKDQRFNFAGALANSPDLGKTTYHNSYTPDSIQDSIPPCPAPYETYDGPEWMCIDQSNIWDR